MDKELQKISGILKRIDELESFMYSGGFSMREIDRMKSYVLKRKKYFFDWFIEE